MKSSRFIPLAALLVLTVPATAQIKLAPADAKAALENLRAEGLTGRGRLVRGKGIPNLEFHYPGPSKMPGGVGKGLAEAMAGLKLLKTPN